VVIALWLAWLLLVPILSPAAAASPADADPNSAKSLIALFEAKYRQAHTLQANFLESYIDNGDVQRSEAGTAYFRRPGKMRFEYHAPESDLFLVDGKTAWFYVPGDHTVMRVPAKQSTDWRTPLALLAGEMKVSRVCSKVDLAIEEKPATEGNAVLRCALRGAEPEPQTAPRRVSASAASPIGKNASSSAPEGSADSTADAVFFEIKSQTGELARLLVRQRGGVQVEFKFAAWRSDPPVPESLFHFDLPPGVAIVNGELPSGEVGVK
jgi:outer membrane lipoprotein-sorting protein